MKYVELVANFYQSLHSDPYRPNQGFGIGLQCTTQEVSFLIV
jgi:hypothetical protein